MSKVVPPSIDAVSFSCPHCGALASQTWYSLSADSLEKNSVPYFPDMTAVARIQTDRELGDDKRGSLVRWATRMIEGEVFTEEDPKSRYDWRIFNLWASRCYSCNALSIWKHKSLLFPMAEVKFEPNPDLPEDIKRDFREAESILMLSPRGAAALLRLAIQKLCTPYAAGA
jgi:hypothetical protein